MTSARRAEIYVSWILIEFTAALLLGAMMTAGCATQPNPVAGIGDSYWRLFKYESVTHYSVSITRHTPGGIAVDDPTGLLDDARIDEIVSRVGACVQSAREPTPLEAHILFCPKMPLRRVFDRASMVVKVAPDWHVSKCSGEELFPCAIDQRGCLAKGLSPTEDCPCQCRHALQWNSVFVVTPNLKLLAAAVVSAATGCTNPWVAPVAECSAP